MEKRNFKDPKKRRFSFGSREEKGKNNKKDPDIEPKEKKWRDFVATVFGEKNTKKGMYFPIE